MPYETSNMGMFTDPYASSADKTKTMVRDPIEIILGSSISDTDCTLQTIVVTYKTVDHYGVELKEDATNPHHLQRLAEGMVTAFENNIYASTSLFEPTTNVTEALVMYNLGRLARETINDDTFMTTIIDLDEELSKSVNGVVKTDNNLFAQDVAAMWFAIGNGDDDMFGEWNFNQWKPEDDCWAGIWITLFYILHHWGVQTCTYFSTDHVRGLGEYITQGGAIEGRLKKLDPYNEADWPLRFLAAVNGVGDVFGLTAAMVDEPALKGVQVPLVDTVEPFIQKYFSRSRWFWRYMRWVDVTPIYTIMPPKVADKNDVILNNAIDDFEYMGLFESSDDVDWDWWNTYLLNFVQRIQRFKFKGKNGGAFGRLKSRIKLVNVFDLPEPGTGKGGLFWHQMSSIRVDTDVGGDDEFLVFKYQPIEEGSDLDYTPALDIYKLQFFRDKMQFYWYQLIGQIDVDMFLFLLGVHATAGKKRNATAGYINGASLDTATNLPDAYNFAYSPCGYVIFTVEKDEDENYYLNPTPADYSFHALDTDSGYTFFGSPPCIYDWSSVSDGLSPTTGDNYYYSKHELNLTRTDYLAMRSSDPYKKLSHVLYDVHNLDVVNIRNVMSKIYLGQSVAKDTAQISVSAGLEPVTQRKDDGAGEIKISAFPDKDKEDDPADDDKFSEKLSAMPEEVKVSVTPEEVDKLKKQLKDKEQQLKKQKDKEAKAEKAKGDKK